MKKPLWEIKQAAEGVLQLYIYGDVEGEEFDWESWRYVQSDNSAEHFREELAKHPDVSRIEIFINSYGGSVFEGTAIYNQLKRHPARKVVHVDGFACSRQGSRLTVRFRVGTVYGNFTSESEVLTA